VVNLDAFIIAIAAMSIASLILILRNTLTERIPTPQIDYPDAELSINLEGRTLRGIVYVSEELPASERDPGRRVLRLARDAGVSVSIVSSLYKVPRDRILKRLEETIGRLEAAYSISRSAKLKSMLENVTSIYEEVALASQPYWGSLSVVVWVPEGPEGIARAEAFKTLLEAELGVSLKRVDKPTCLRALASTPGARPNTRGSLVLPPRQHNVSGKPVVLGWRLDLESAVYALDYPRDFTTHVGVVGPTGKGKTVLLAGIASQLIALNKADRDPYLMAILDPKGDLASLISSLGNNKIKILGPTHSVGDGVKVIEDLWNAWRQGVEGRAVIIVDEAWRYMRVKPEIFEAIAREGRSIGFHVVYAVQEPSDIPVPVADNTGLFIVFGGKTSSYAEAASRLGLGALAKELTEMPVGEAIVVRRDSSPVPVRVMNFAKLLKTSEGSWPPPRDTGELRVGKEATSAENGEGLANVQESGSYPSGTSKVSSLKPRYRERSCS
jgi:hypothetical protein